MTSRTINPLGNCDSSSWLLSLDPSDSNDKSFKLKFVADNAVAEDLWLALNGDDEYYLEVAGSYGAQFDPAAKFDIGNNFYNKYPGSGNNLSDYRLKVWDQTENCLGWKREITGSGNVDVKELAPTDPLGAMLGSLVQGGDRDDVAT